jgi:NAD(P)-dependent dehydrogenase (short-subunit alcohol dehydrogenase family)
MAVLKGRVALVTGASRGIGRAIAISLAEAGAAVAVNYVTKAAEAQAVVAAIHKQGGRAIEVGADVSRAAAVKGMVTGIERELGPIDVLINNAGACFHRPALEVPAKEWRAVWDVNVDGLWHCSRTVGAQMVERRAGVIVNIGSISAMIVNRPQMQPAYNASKAAVHQLTKSLAAEWAPYGIRVNALAPGYTKTEMAPVDEPRFRRHWIEDAPMERYATPEELGPSLLYLASDASSFVTGSVLVVDGGYTLW